MKPERRWRSDYTRAVRPMLVAVAILACARPADACDCPALDENEAMRASAFVFDGWVIEAPQPWSCPVPPAPRTRKGCARIAVIRREDCKAGGDLLGLRASDGSVVSPTSIEDDATTFCGIKPGTYFLGASPTWVGTENGTLDHGRTLDIVPGGSYSLFAPGRVGQLLRVGVFRALKGQIAREVVVHTEPDCGTPFVDAGAALRFFARARPDGSVAVRGCSSTRPLTDAERAELVATPASGSAAPTASRSATSPPPASQPAARTGPPAAQPRSGSCSTTPPTDGILVPLLIWRRRRKRSGAAAP